MTDEKGTTYLETLREVKANSTETNRLLDILIKREEEGK